METYHCINCHTLFYACDLDQAKKITGLEFVKDKTTNLQIGEHCVYCKTCRYVIGHTYGINIFNINPSKVFRIVKN